MHDKSVLPPASFICDCSVDLSHLLQIGTFFRFLLSHALNFDPLLMHFVSYLISLFLVYLSIYLFIYFGCI
jgi:hypothetical protein